MIEIDYYFFIKIKWETSFPQNEIHSMKMELSPTYYIIPCRPYVRIRIRRRRRRRRRIHHPPQSHSLTDMYSVGKAQEEGLGLGLGLRVRAIRVRVTGCIF